MLDQNLSAEAKGSRIFVQKSRSRDLDLDLNAKTEMDKLKRKAMQPFNNPRQTRDETGVRSVS